MSKLVFESEFDELTREWNSQQVKVGRHVYKFAIRGYFTPAGDPQFVPWVTVDFSSNRKVLTRVGNPTFAHAVEACEAFLERWERQVRRFD